MACIIHCEANASLAGIRQQLHYFCIARLFSQKNVGTHHFVFNKKIRAHMHD
jgi:hypothetical protein